jgi:hypothetical protein
MRVIEAAWIGAALAEFSANALTPFLDIGSGGELSFAEAKIFRPLAERGVRVVHFDRQSFPWVDIAGDIFDPAVQRRLANLPVRGALFANVIEHLPKETVPRLPFLLRDILAPGAILVVSAPLSFPYHQDPIDTMLRPTPEQLAQLFAAAGFEPLRAEALSMDSFAKDLNERGIAGWLHWLFRLMKPFRRRDKWLNAAHSALWLFRPYRQSLIVLRRGA